MESNAKSAMRGRKQKTKPNGVMNGDSSGLHPVGNGSTTPELRLQSRNERQQLVLWRSPLSTFYYFILEIGVLLRSFAFKYGFYLFILNS